jgi:hypothetical protein
MENNTYEIYYDEQGDFLEVFFGEATKCYTEEPEQGIFIRKDQETNEIRSIGILSFKKRGAKILDEILIKTNKKLPIQISI